MNSYFTPYYSPYMGLINGSYSSYLPCYPYPDRTNLYFFGSNSLVLYNNPYLSQINPYIGSYFGFYPYT